MVPRFLVLCTGPGGELDRDVARRGMVAWRGWIALNADHVVDGGAPLGPTKRVTADGVSDIRNACVAYTIVEADDHDAAARLFEKHPSFSVFPGDGVEIMPILPLPD